jgi:hypothetical protein
VPLRDEIDMMETARMGVRDDERIEALSKSAQRFRGKLIKVIIIEVSENESNP